MRAKTKVVTHHGGAHRDEFMACCVILYKEFAENGKLAQLERRPFTEADLESVHTWVVDTGGVWEPEKRNFDHHQENDPRVVDRCSLDLVMEYFSNEKELRRFRAANPWLTLTTTHDCRGSKEAAVSLGVNERTYASMQSPIERLLLRRFSEVTILYPESTLHAEMREIGRLLCHQMIDLKAHIDILNQLPGPVDVDGIRVWDVRDAFRHLKFESYAPINVFAAANNIDVTISPNARNSSVALYRSDGAVGKVDFNMIRDHPLIKMSHINGFYAVIKPGVALRDHQIRELIRASIVRKKD